MSENVTPTRATAITKVFISCVSKEFGSYRARLKHQLLALRGTPYEVRVQEDFQQGDDTLLDSLADYVRECDLVVHLVGDAAGAQPSAQHERTLLRHLGEPQETALTGRSFTQWEYHLARRFGRKTRVYLAEPEALRDCAVPVVQSEEDANLQRAHAQALMDVGKYFGRFEDPRDLVRKLFHDLGLQADLKVNNLPYASLGTLFKGRDEFLDKLRAELSRVEGEGHQQMAAITGTAATVHGLGGIGKTRVAVCTTEDNENGPASAAFPKGRRLPLSTKMAILS